MLGIVQEQHPDRTRLFMQWREMDWPILVDSLNLLGVSAVPITLLIDEAGTIQAIQPDDDALEVFLAQPPAGGPRLPGAEPDIGKLRVAAESGQRDALLSLADALYLWKQDPTSLDEVISIYSQLISKDPSDGVTHFRLGVAYRRRFESLQADPDDFRRAVSHWGRALDINPNQYIWRRRIQQYGPRLDKPYSFYDWIHQARIDLKARGEQPWPLPTEPGGAEFAYPAEEAKARQVEVREPDPGGRILRDREGLIRSSVVAVPDTSSNRRAVRVHLRFQPETERKAHWNNEVEDMVVWVKTPEFWAANPKLIRYPVPAQPVSQETRTVEFELEALKQAVGAESIGAYALYYVCEDVNGTCLYRRLDVDIPLEENP